MIRSVASPARSALLVFLALLLPYLGVTPASVGAQTTSTTAATASSKINFPLPTYRAWQDQSGNLPGTSSSTTVLVIAGVVVVTAAVAFLVIRHNKRSGKTKDSPKDSTNVSPVAPAPSGPAVRSSRPDPSGPHLPKFFVGVDPAARASGARWEMGLSWAF